MYSRTKELWQEGKILLVEGTVKLRDEQVNINCYRARQYPPTDEENQETQPVTQPPLQRKLIININQSDKAEEDEKRLHQVTDVLSRYPGQDIVQLVILTPEQMVSLELPKTTNYCPELAQEINNILGANSLRLEETE